MENMELVKKFTDWNPTGLRTKRRADKVVNDLDKLKRRNWSQTIKDRKA
jgi:hypothetical protein